MVDLSEKELERLRQLEEEVERDRQREKKAKEEAEAKAREMALVPTESPDASEEEAKKKAIVKAAVKEVETKRESRVALRNKILLGGTGMALLMFLWVNILQIIGIGVLLGGGYFALNKYLVGEGDSKSAGDDTDESSKQSKG